MSVMLMKCLIEKKLKIQKAPNVQGSVRIHFPNAEIEDIVLTNHEVVDVFGRINVNAEEIKKSNLGMLISRGDVQIA